MSKFSVTTVSELKGKTIAFAGSGGLDSCTITRWLTDHGVKVVCFTADLGQPDEEDMDDIGKRMRASGAIDFVLVPLQAEIAEAGLKLVQAQAVYEGGYWNTTGIARHVTTRGIVAAAKKKGISILAHGATGRGNDQVRFQIVTSMLEPDFAVYAPWRDPAFLEAFRGRSEMIDFCEAKGIPIKASKSKPYSTDANLLGLTHEAGKLESLETPAQFITPGFGVHAADAPEKPEELEIRFERGRPVAINGKKLSVLEVFHETNRLAGRNGVGIAVHVVENRLVGIKSRGVYEQPGMELLGKCYEWLLQVTIDRRARELFDSLSDILARQVYHGYWFDLCSQMATAGVEKIAQLITGTVRVSLYKGNIACLTITDAPHSIYSEADASMEAIGGFDHNDSEGLLRIFALSARALARAEMTSADHADAPKK